jgi:selenocysteine-specific elongation factor
MHVVATAGHVDHGKSTLVKALTGTDPDRLPEEHRRGLSIELGYCWTVLPPVGDVAFVDVPGHERFLPTMLSGAGPVPAALFVLAADDPWMPQAAEHLAALDALGVSHAVVAVTRADLADPAAAMARAEEQLRPTSLRGAPVVAVSGRTGQGLDALRQALARTLASLPDPDPAADVRLWVDRRFSRKGAGAVVTGTLPAGSIRHGDTLQLGGQPLRVRGLQSLGQPVDQVRGVARVAANLTGDDLTGLVRGSVLVTPSAWLFTDVVDVRVRPPAGGDAAQPYAAQAYRLPEAPLLHVGAASVATHCRPLAEGLLRLRLDRKLPLRVGDRALLRDPGSRALWGVTVLDPAPPRLDRRGAAARRAKALEAHPGRPDLRFEVTCRGLVRVSTLKKIGVPPRTDEPLAATGTDGWLLSDSRSARASAEIERVLAEHDRRSPLDPGMPLAALAERVGLPSPQLVARAVRPPLRVRDGRVVGGRGPALPEPVQRAVEALRADLAETPFAAPTADRLGELGLDQRAVAAAAKAGRLLRLADGIVLLPGADVLATRRLEDLPQPFTASQARARLDTSRRVVLPLLAHLDKVGATRRLPDDRRTVARFD